MGLFTTHTQVIRMIPLNTAQVWSLSYLRASKWISVTASNEIQIFTTAFHYFFKIIPYQSPLFLFKYKTHHGKGILLFIAPSSIAETMSGKKRLAVLHEYFYNNWVNIWENWEYFSVKCGKILRAALHTSVGIN